MRKLSFLFLALVGFLPANAQYTFTCNGGFSGDCAKVSGVRELNQQLQQIMRQAFAGFPDEASCNQARNIVNNIKSQAEIILGGKRYNCHFKLNALPCTGRPIGGTNVGTPNVLGVSQGSSFFSTNTVNEIKNWSEDDMERMLALDKDNHLFEPTNVITGDVNFDNARTDNGIVFHSTSSIPYIGDGIFKGIPDAPLLESTIFGQANIYNVNRYLEDSYGLGVAYIANPQDLSSMLQRQFLSLSGYDINVIINKMDKTDAEKQALADYNEYAKRMCDQMASEIDKQMGRIDQSEEKKQIDMAIIAKDCYGDDSKGYLSMTDYKRITSINIDDPYIKSIAETIELCNTTHDETGFNAVLYFNEKTGGYVLGCEGSSMPSIEVGSKYYPEICRDEESGTITLSSIIAGVPISATFTKDNINDWGLNNIIQGFGGTAAQFELAHTIGNAINMLPKEVRNNLDLCITGHSLGGGLASVIGLTTGKTTYTYNAEGISDRILKDWGLLEKKERKDYDITAYHSSGDVLTIAQKGAQNIGVSFITGNILHHNVGAEAIGKSVNVGFKGIHQQGPMVEHFIKENIGTQSEWERIRYSRNSILAAKQDGSIQKIDHINVIFR